MPSWYISGFERPRGPIFTGAAVAASTTWNDADRGTGIALSNGFLDATKLSADNVWQTVRGTTTKSSGKRYYEIMRTGAGFSAYVLGIAVLGGDINQEMGSLTVSSAGYQSGGAFVQEGAFTAGGTSGGVAYQNGDRANIAVDIDAGKLFIGINGVYTGIFTGQDPTTGANPSFTFTPGLTLAPALSLLGNGTGDVAARLLPTAASQTDGAPSGFTAWG